MHTVNVWPSKFVTGWNGDQAKMPSATYPVVGYRGALFSTYDTDAHFCPAVLPGATTQPRLRTSDATPALLNEVRFTILALDIDAPDHKADEAWWDATIETIQAQPLGNGIIYCTRGGIRVIYELINSLTIPEYQAIHTRTRRAYKDFGITVDELTDWTRCYRLPFVVRDGVLQDLPVYDSRNPVLLENMLPRVAETESMFKRAATDHTLSEFKVSGLAAVDTMGRNQTLFRVASAFRDFRWMDKSTLEVAVSAINDSLDEPLQAAELRVIINSAWDRYVPTRGPEDIEEEPDPEAEDNRPEVQIRAGELHVAQDESIKALTRAQNLYVREGKLVRIVSEGTIQDLPHDSMPAILSRCANFTKSKASRDPITKEVVFEDVSIDPPVALVNGVYSAGEYPLRELRGVQRTPTIRPDGTLIWEKGYDPSTRLYNAFNVEIDPTAVGDTRSAAEAALGRLVVMFDEFPFGGPEHLSVTLAALMTPLLRPAISGPTPLFIFDSNTPGSGKTIQADVVSLVATGKEAPRMAATKEEEMEKRITAILLMGDPVVLIDNVESGKALGGTSLDALLTSDVWTGRYLARTEMIKLPNLAVWMATGNNLRVKGDLARRSLRSYLDPQMERPEERTFRITDLRAHVLEHRAQIITDVLTIARARHASGFRGTSFGSFESWSYWVREALVWLGMTDPLVSQSPLRDSDQSGIWRRFLDCAWSIWGTKPFTPRDIQEAGTGTPRFGGDPDAYAGLETVLAELVRDPSNLAQVGALMKTWSSRVLGGCRLVPSTRVTLRGPSFVLERTDGAIPLSDGRRSASLHPTSRTA